MSDQSKKESFPFVLREIRERKGINASRAAMRCEISPSQYWRYESLEWGPPSFTLFKRLVDGLQLTDDDIVRLIRAE